MTRENTLKFAGNYSLEISGKLIAEGTPTEHITFTSAQSTPSPGDWLHINFQGSDSGSVMDYCDVSYGGSYNGCISFNSGPNHATITNSVIANSGSEGIYLNDSWASYSRPVISGCTIRDNTTYGINALDGISYPFISDCIIENNGSYAMRVWGNGVRYITGTMTVTGNQPNAIYVNGDNVYTGTWLNHGVPYVIGGNQAVIDGQTLTISPGDTLKFNNGMQLQVAGTLVAQGIVGSHITFTSSQDSPTPGDWDNVDLNYSDPGTVLDYCDILYGGSTNGNVNIRGCGSNVTVSNSRFAFSGHAGVYVDDYNTVLSYPVLTNCVMENNTTYGVQGNSSGNITLNNCLIQNNGSGFYSNWNTHYFQYHNQIINNTNYGVYLTGNTGVVFGDELSEWNDIYGNGTYNFYNSSSNIDAHIVYWGSTDSTQIASTIFDHYDNASLGIVDFSPWTNAAHDRLYPITPPATPEHLVIITNCQTANCDSVQLVWDSVPGATSYRVYSSLDPDSEFAEDTTGTFNGTSWSAPISEVKRFYRVITVGEDR